MRLLGHSFGGLVARAAVIADPGAFESLVLLSSGPAELDGVRRVTMDGLEPVLAASGLPGVYAAMQATALGDPGFVAPPDDLAEFLERRFLGGSPDMLQGMADALRHEPDRVDELAGDRRPGAGGARRRRRRLAAGGAGRHGAPAGGPLRRDRRRGALGRGREPGRTGRGAAGFLGTLTLVTSDLGYFGPQSMTWRIHGEPVSMVGGLRALLLQALHPGAMERLYTRSNFKDDPWQRLESTVHYVGTVSFGARADVDAASARVRAVHQRLGIDDPEQLAWVHLCLVDSFLSAARAAGLRLGRAEADRYVSEQALAASFVGVPADRVPTSAAELAERLAAMRDRLRATPQAREAARVVLAPPMPVPVRYLLPARLGWTTVSALAVGLLPGWAVRMYGLPVLPGRSLATAAGLRALRGAVRALPAQYREGPLYREAKERAAAS